MAHELAEARARLLETEVSTVLTNHALGIYELAAIHLTADQPNLVEAQLAIDAWRPWSRVWKAASGKANRRFGMHSTRPGWPSSSGPRKPLPTPNRPADHRIAGAGAGRALSVGLGTTTGDGR